MVADRESYVTETIETDNAASIDIEFIDPQAPDLRVAAIVVNPASPRTRRRAGCPSRASST